MGRFSISGRTFLDSYSILKLGKKTMSPVLSLIFLGVVSFAGAACGDVAGWFDIRAPSHQAKSAAVNPDADQEAALDQRVWNEKECGGECGLLSAVRRIRCCHKILEEVKIVKMCGKKCYQDMECQQKCEWVTWCTTWEGECDDLS